MVKKRLIIFGCTMLALIGLVATFSNEVVANMNLGLELKGGFEILYEIEPLETASKNTEIDMAAVASAVTKRVDVLGVNEPEISVEGNRIRVQLAGIKNNEEARKIISSSATLTFRDTNDKLLMDATVLKEGGASVQFDNGKPVVSLKIADTAKFGQVTTALAATTDKLMVTWLDYKEGQSYRAELAKANTKEGPAYISAATVSQGLTSESVVISGGFTEKDAQSLSDLLNSGSLNFKMTEVYSNVVSPNLGTNAFDTTIFAGLIGIAVVMLFMIAYYRFPGIISAVSIGAYTIAVLFIYSFLGGVFTLSGIAGLVLGVGMALDSSVITFERIKDGLLEGRSVKQAHKEGTQKSNSTIFDSQLTTLLSATILYAFGTGSVKGFATMLMISTILTVLFNVSIVRFLLGQIVKSGYLDDKKIWFGIKDSDVPNLALGEKKKKVSRFSTFDFISNAKYFVGVSAVVLIVGIGSMIVNTAGGNGPFDLGIDFSSGTKITITSPDVLDAKELKTQIASFGVKVDNVTLSGEGKKIATVAIKDAINEEQRIKINDYVTNNLKGEASDSIVSPVVGQELVKNAFIMSILSWIAILIYVSFRFKWDYAVSGIVALIHDVVIILAVFAIFRMEVTTDIIAVLLAIIGYSMNDTIVIFDRMREHVASYGRKNITNEQYRALVNSALQETVVRSVITTLVTVIPVIALLVLGSQSIFTFNLALLIGLIAGANSSIFIAAQLWFFIRCRIKPKHKVKKKRKKVDEVEEHIIAGVND